MSVDQRPSRVVAARITTEEYDRMADAGVFGPDRGRIELIGGALYEMPPIGTAHLIAVTRLQVQLAALNAQGRLLVQQPVRIPKFDEPQPDLTILRVPLRNTKPEAMDCELVIEVSDSTLRFDREQKLLAYKAGGIKRVWIVDVVHRLVEEYATPEWRQATHFPGEAQLEVAGIRVDLEAVLLDMGEIPPGG
jgi:Uma2 family endonuclease